jgi:hypothetical protein
MTKTDLSGPPPEIRAPTPAPVDPNAPPLSTGEAGPSNPAAPAGVAGKGGGGKGKGKSKKQRDAEGEEVVGVIGEDGEIIRMDGVVEGEE